MKNMARIKQGRAIVESRLHKAVLVYQAGIANVFEIGLWDDEARQPRRILQSDFRECEAFSRGLREAGWDITSMYCNQAGDITDAEWNTNLEDAPFSDKFNPVYTN